MIIDIAIGIVVAVIILWALPSILAVAGVALAAGFAIALIGLAGWLVYFVATNPDHELSVLAMLGAAALVMIVSFIAVKGKVKALGGLANAWGYFRIWLRPARSDHAVIEKAKALEELKDRGKAVIKATQQHGQKVLRDELRSWQGRLGSEFAEYFKNSSAYIKTENLHSHGTVSVRMGSPKPEPIAILMIVIEPVSNTKADIRYFCNAGSFVSHQASPVSVKAALKVFRKSFKSYFKRNPDAVSRDS
jgi:hypothetical protein